jgi:very-short-patch-repair endonuclease
MYKMLSGMKVSMRLPFESWVQFPLGPYRADFAIPQIRLAIECDGYAWHSDPIKKAKDQARDAELAKYGWTTIRFNEFELKENQGGVQKTVSGLIFKLWKAAIEQQKKQPGKKGAAIQPMSKQAMSADIDGFEFGEMIYDSRLVVSFVSPPLGMVPMSPLEGQEGDAGEEADGNAYQGSGD